MTASKRRPPLAALTLTLAALAALAGCSSGGTTIEPTMRRGFEAEGAAASRGAGFESAMRLGEAAAAGGDTNSALRILNGVAEQNPAAPEPQRALADAYYGAGLWPEAAAAYRRLATLDPGSRAALVGLGRTALAQGDAAQAGTHFAAALALTPGDPMAANGLAVSLDLRGDHQGAQRLYDEILARDPANRGVMSNRALSRALAGDPRGAAAELDELARARLRAPQATHNLALAYALGGQLGKAEQVLVAALPAEEAAENLAFYRTLR